MKPLTKQSYEAAEDGVGGRGKKPINLPPCVPGLMCYGKDGDLISLPPWAHFCLATGLVVGNEPVGKTRHVVVLSLPARPYAAVLAAVGVVIARARLAGAGMGHSTHFQMLSYLPAGASVVLRCGGKRIRGKLCGCQTFQDCTRIGVQVTDRNSGGLTYWLLPEESTRISVAVEQARRLPNNPREVKAGTKPEFVRQLLGADGAIPHSTQSALDCAVFGPVNALMAEIDMEALALEDPAGSVVIGTAQEILRPRNPASHAETYRSEVFRVNSKRPPRLGAYPPHAAIFDGASGFLRWRHRLPTSHLIVLLDRTDMRFREAAEMVNQAYVRRANGVACPRLPEIPPGVEVAAFAEDNP